MFTFYYLRNQMKQYTLIIIILTTLLAGCGYQQANERIDSLYVQGKQYTGNDQWDSAMIVFSEAERLLNPQTDMVMRGKVYASLSHLWRTNSNIPKAIEYREKAWQAYDKAGDEDLSALSLLMIGDYHSDFKTPEGRRKALEYIDQANAYQNINDTTRGSILQQKALYYFFVEQCDSAIFYFHLAFLYPDETQYKCINRLYLGISHYKLEQLDSAKLYVTEALTYPAGFRQRSGCHNMLRKIAEAQGDSAAYHYYATMSIVYKDSTMRKENSLSRQATAMDDKVDALQDKKHRRQMTTIAIALALVVIVALAVYCLRTKYHQKQKEEWSLGLDEAENRAKQAEKALQEEQLAHQNTIYQNQENRRKKVELCINELRIEYMPIQHYWKEEEWNALKRSMLLHGMLFLKHLTQQYPNLNMGEIHLCILELLGFSQAEMAVCLALSPNTINKKRLRLAQKLDERLHSLRSHLITLCE